MNGICGRVDEKKKKNMVRLYKQITKHKNRNKIGKNTFLLIVIKCKTC